MLRAVLFFVQLAIVLVVAVWLAENPGRIEVEWLGYRIDTYFALVLIALAALFGGLMVLARLLRGFLMAPGSFFAGRAMKRRDEGYKALMHGMAAVAAGDAAEAKKMSRRADALLHDPSLTRLLQAQAAALNGDDAAAQRYFQALADEPETEFLGVTGLMRLAAGHDEAAMRTLAERARQLRPGSPVVLGTLFDLQSRAGDWSAAQPTLYEAIRAGAIDEEVGRGHRTAIYTERAMAAEREGKLQEALALVDQALKALSTFVPAAAFKARLQTRLDRKRRAARDLEAFWRHTPHPDIAEAYGAIWPNDPPIERLKRLRSLVAPNPDVIESRVAVATAALDAELWGEARAQLEAIEPDQRTSGIYRLMARLEESERSDVAAARALLGRAATGPADPSWTCDACGGISERWTALCGNCGAFDSVAWRQPPRITALPAVVGAAATDGTDAPLLDGTATAPENRTAAARVSA